MNVIAGIPTTSLAALFLGLGVAGLVLFLCFDKLPRKLALAAAVAFALAELSTLSVVSVGLAYDPMERGPMPQAQAEAQRAPGQQSAQTSRPNTASGT
ncbi:hypothetical protein GT347_03865 [Xylophilus rhododendri]|uniref:Uncharacterized protein n=1 Tax=Xylophilus rhododendri TaxID=2697032 RepID=A0A857J010_9BURK|nr:hypothetical protein [Xylophilus rhododendri]QHI97190.1 hypothetical protein GT347_03865 [Xylophilus rhododendri]